MVIAPSVTPWPAARHDGGQRQRRQVKAQASPPNMTTVKCPSGPAHTLDVMGRHVDVDTTGEG
ncbi:MAG: hypothetical protein IPH44_42650 [Myxococcales bacterium]|nr:hypothetical protein [Myxococcales bacterium]MBK7192903.1 hypothetical protein [Myxococcales bacterium]MBP6845497.1 hypothetical protein [Kofleriaceae bacterium]